MVQPSEPMLFPKLRIRFADFPYLHCVYGLKASNLGDRMRLFGTAADEGSARVCENSLGFSMKTMGAPSGPPPVPPARPAHASTEAHAARGGREGVEESG